MILVDPKRLSWALRGHPTSAYADHYRTEAGLERARNAVREMSAPESLAAKEAYAHDQYNRLFDGSTASLFEEGDESGHCLTSSSLSTSWRT